MSELLIKSGDVVIIQAFDEIPSHRFLVEEVHDEFITGYALTGPLAGEYGEPDSGLILLPRLGG